MPTPPAIPQKAIFHERDGWAYYVANWQTRFTTGAKAVLVKLSPRHFARYHRLKDAGRSPKSICIALFKKNPPSAPVVLVEERETRETSRVHRQAEQRPGTVTIDIDVLTGEQLVTLINRHLGVRISGLRTLALSDLRKLYLALTHAECD